MTAIRGAGGTGLSRHGPSRWIPLAASWGELTTARGVSVVDTTVQDRKSHPGRKYTATGRFIFYFFILQMGGINSKQQRQQRQQQQRQRQQQQ